MKYQKLNLKNKSVFGFTLIDVLIGIFLISIIFLAMYGLYRLSIIVVEQSRNKISATAIAQGQIEKIRNLPYESVGIKGGFPDGVLESSTTTIQNNNQYIIETRADYIADPADGIAYPQDDCPNDYKRVEIKVSWPGMLGGEVSEIADISPKNLNQECAAVGGILYVSVFDAFGVMVPSPLIEVKNPATDQNIKTAAPAEGEHYFSLSTSTYKVVVSKPGYSTERTYGINEVATPENPNPIVIEGKLTEISFSIDRVSSFSVDTLSSWGSGSFSDSFSDESKIVASSNLVIGAGQVTLATTTSGYSPSGYLISDTISSGELVNWGELNYSDNIPSNTHIRYQVLYFDGGNWILVPDSDIPGNSSGLSPAPIDFSRLDIVTYPQIRIKATLFSEGSHTNTPTLYTWQTSFVTNQTIPIPNVVFSLRGNKIIGTDASENPVYKYSISTTTDSGGHKDISGLEWDSYTFSVASSTGLSLISIDPSPQPVPLAPNSSGPVKLYLSAQNSLLVTLQDVDTSEPVFAASVRVYNTTISYDKTQYTNSDGQTYFIPLQNKTYNLEISAPGYLSTSTTISVSGQENKVINLEQEE
jgi:hypothetical protein